MQKPIGSHTYTFLFFPPFLPPSLLQIIKHLPFTCVFLLHHQPKRQLKNRSMFLKPRAINQILSSLSNPFKTQRSTYVDVLMKWKKDTFFDSVDILANNKDLRPLLTLKNTLIAEPDNCIPISYVSKRARDLEISGRVAGFLRKYPSFFEEFTGPKYNLPHFRLTGEAMELHRFEQHVFETRKADILDRLRRLILMSKDNVLPVRVVQGMLWYLGLPEDFLKNPDGVLGMGFENVEIGDGEMGLRAVIEPKERIYSAVERGSVDRFLLFPSKGLRLKRKIEDWLERFQELPYVSPYANYSGLDPNSDVAEKRVVGVLHELLAIFVDGSAERRKLLCLRTHLGLPQKFGKCFERHPHVFYLLLKNKTCFVVLKELYCGGRSGSGIERHPMFEVRKRYAKLMSLSDAILRSRRGGMRGSSESREDANGVSEVTGHC